MNDSDFDRFLKSTSQAPELPASFQHDVWRRIEATDAAVTLSWADRLFASLVRPSRAILAVAMTVAVGLWFGSTSTQGQRVDPKIAYVASVSPFAHSPMGDMP